MNLPKTTEFSLKTIVENMSSISSKMGASKPEAMPIEMKRQLKEMALMFNEYGKAFEGEQTIMDASTAIGEFIKLAEMYAVNEGGDVFQENIIKQNFAEVQKKVGQLQKLAQECYVRKQQLGVLFDDIRHVVTRYYKIEESAGVPSNPTPANKEKKCVVCQKTLPDGLAADTCGKCLRAQRKSMERGYSV